MANLAQNRAKTKFTLILFEIVLSSDAGGSGSPKKKWGRTYKAGLIPMNHLASKVTRQHRTHHLAKWYEYETLLKDIAAHDLPKNNANQLFLQALMNTFDVLAKKAMPRLTDILAYVLTMRLSTRILISKGLAFYPV